MLLFILLSVIIVISVIICAVLFVPFYLQVLYKKDAVLNTVDIWIKYMFFSFKLTPRKKKKKDKLEKKDGSKKKMSFESVSDGVKQFVKKFEIIKDDIADVFSFLANKAVHIESLKIGANIGLDNAMHTALCVGSVYAAAYNVLGLIHRYSNIREWNINAAPDFDQKRFDLEAECILKIKSVHIMIIAIKALKIYFKFSKKEEEA